MRIVRIVAAVSIAFWLTGSSRFARVSPATTEQSAPATTAPPPDEGLRSLIRSVENTLRLVPDRGAALFFLARLYTRVGEFPKAMALLKQCVALDQGFDPAAHRRLEPLKDNPEFQKLAEQVHRANLPVHHARVAFTVADKDLFPEGLAADAEKNLFYMGSMHRKKIVSITTSGAVSDFVPEDRYDLMPVGGVHVDPSDHSVWAATDPGEKNRSEIVHFDAHGELLERYTAPGEGTHDLNDLVLRGTQEIFVTDTDANLVFRFDRKSHSFTTLKFPRPIFYPNGIVVSDDDSLLYVGDMLGVIVVDLRTGSAQDVVPDIHDTLSGIDGLYWYKGALVGVQYGTGAFRVMRWHLAKDGRKVAASEVLERGTELVKNPTTGAIFEGKFYFMANTGIQNLEHDKIVDESKLEPVQIAVVALDKPAKEKADSSLRSE
jgi:sugar lactone lactonase YvrE